jgi:hypothetical protein
MHTLKFWESGSNVTCTPSLKFFGSEIINVSGAWEDFSFLNILEKLPFLMPLIRTWPASKYQKRYKNINKDETTRT